MIAIIVTTIFVILISLLLYSKKQHNYWASNGVYTPEGCKPFIGHTLQLFFKFYRWNYLDKIYRNHKDKKIWGMYTAVAPVLFVVDLDLIKLVLVKDANNFIDHQSFGINEEKDKLFKEFLTILKGEQWKAVRNMMTPAFTSGKIKGMFPLVEEKSTNLMKVCDQKMDEEGFVEMHCLLKRFVLDVIGSCSFGIEINSLINEDGEIEKAAHGIINPSARVMFKFILILFFSGKLFKLLNLSLEGPNMKLLEKNILDVIKIRQETGKRRGDFVDLMLDSLKVYKETIDKKETNYEMSLNTIVSQCLLFLLAGYDTASHAMVFLVYLLSKNIHCQDELRKELQKIMEADGEITYQNLMEASYLDACLSESLRMYSPAHHLERTCTKAWKVPGYDFVLPENKMINIPVWSLHYDPEYWDDPTTYNPERFMPEHKANIIPYTYLPFGQGPRNCIGKRFALMEVKLAVAHLVLNYEMSLKPGFEMKLHGSSNTLRPDKDGVKIIMKRLPSKEKP